MSEALAQYYFRQIVAGLACLHSQNVVHGDVKPDNVLLSGSGLVKLADFGQAHFFNEGDVFNKTMGTPAFLGGCGGRGFWKPEAAGGSRAADRARGWTLPTRLPACPLHVPAAPEIRSGDPYHGRPADMWALGVTLYVFLFGDLPFKASLHSTIQHRTAWHGTACLCCPAGLTGPAQSMPIACPPQQAEICSCARRQPPYDGKPPG